MQEASLEEDATAVTTAVTAGWDTTTGSSSSSSSSSTAATPLPHHPPATRPLPADSSAPSFKVPVQPPVMAEVSTRILVEKKEEEEEEDTPPPPASYHNPMPAPLTTTTTTSLLRSSSTERGPSDEKGPRRPRPATTLLLPPPNPPLSEVPRPRSPQSTTTTTSNPPPLTASSTRHLLQQFDLLPTRRRRPDHQDDDDDEAHVLWELMQNTSHPPVSWPHVQAALAWERRAASSKGTAVQNDSPDPAAPPPQQDTVVILVRPLPVAALLAHPNSDSGGGSSSSTSTSSSSSSSSMMMQSKPALLQLPVPWAAALLRLLIQVLTGETSPEYDRACGFSWSWKYQPPLPTSPPSSSTAPLPLASASTTPAHPWAVDWQREAQQAVHTDHATRRPHALYNAVRFLSAWSLTTHPRPSKISPLWTLLRLWEAAVTMPSHERLWAPLSRLVGLLAAAGIEEPSVLRRILHWAQQSSIPAGARLAWVRALTTAAVGTLPRATWLPKWPPKHFFSLAGQPLQRTVTGLSTWPFRNDFGLALWFRAECFTPLSGEGGDRSTPARSPLVLFAAKTDNGGGLEVVIVPLEGSDAATLAVYIYDSGRPAASESYPVHSLRVKGCVLLPRVWYHVAVRHTRSRLKGVFSLSTRQQVSVFLDGKVMMTDSLPFPKVSEADFKNNESTASSLMGASLRRSSLSHSILNLTLVFGQGFQGQTGALFVFNDHVSDASFRKLYEMTGGRRKAVRRSSSHSDTTWDAKRSDLVRKSRVLDVTHEDVDEIVLSHRRRSSTNKIIMTEKFAAVVDLGEGDDPDETGDIPQDLAKIAFGSKVFLCWDPRRSIDTTAIELHIGAHAKLESASTWVCHSPQEVIGSMGGVQALIPLFRSFFSGEIERTWAFSSDVGPNDVEGTYTTLPDLFDLLAAFVQDHNENARELLRCGGVDIIEQLLHNGKKNGGGKRIPRNLLGALNLHPGLAFRLVESLLRLRNACSHYHGLEIQIFARILFNIPLWLGGLNQAPGAALSVVLLPVLSMLTKMNSEKVRECMGIKDMVHALKDYADDPGPVDTTLDRFSTDGWMVSPAARLSLVERQTAIRLLLAMVYEVLASGCTPQDVSAFLHLISYSMDNCRDKEPASVEERQQGWRYLAAAASTTLLFLLQIRPPVSGLFESIAHCCSSVQGGACWIVGAMVNTTDDDIRGIGVRCLAYYMDATFRGDDAPLSLVSSLQPTEPDSVDVSSSVLRASTRFSMIAIGLAAMGPSSRTVNLRSSKVTPRIICKLLFHVLKNRSVSLGMKTYSSLISWISEDNGVLSSSLSSIEFIESNYLANIATIQPGIVVDVAWAEKVLTESSSIVGKSLRNQLVIVTVLHLIRHIPDDQKVNWVSDLLSLARSSRKGVSLLSSLPEWQPCLFNLISETLESFTELISNVPIDSSEKLHMVNGAGLSCVAAAKSLTKRLDSCLDLAGTLLGHLLREGGDKALEAVERTASLQRICPNGQHVLFLMLSALCADIFDNGTLLEPGSISAEDWKDVDLEQDSLLLKQSARLVTDAILLRGTKGLDMSTAVRSWRSMRHLTEVVVAVVTRSGYGIADLFDYINQQASSLDVVSGGLHGIRLPDGRLYRVSGADYIGFLGFAGHGALRGDPALPSSEDYGGNVSKRLCVSLAAQILSLLDAFVFPDSLEASLPTSHLHGIALVRNSEARLGSSQGPLVSSVIRLSLLLLVLLEPCSVKFLQCASRLRCLLYWVLELIRETSAADGRPTTVDASEQMDHLLLCIVLHCHRALGRCASLLFEIESSSYEKYFPSEAAKRKAFRRLLRASLEMRDIVSTIFKGRAQILRVNLSTTAYEVLRSSLEGPQGMDGHSSKETVATEFLRSGWVSSYQDVEMRGDISVPEQLLVSQNEPKDEQVSERPNDGFSSIEALSKVSMQIVTEFEKAVDRSFEDYLEDQRRWSGTNTVRDLEYESDLIVRKMIDRHKSEENESTKSMAIRKQSADLKLRGVCKKVVDPWKGESHWKLAKYTDRIGRRILLVQNPKFNPHRDASYELVLGKEREEEERQRQMRLLEKNAISEVMRRNADAFIVSSGSTEFESSEEEVSVHPSSDGESSTEVDSSTDADSFDGVRGIRPAGLPLDESEHEDEWDKIDSEDVEDVDAHGDMDGWAKSFIWADGESVVARFERVMIVSLQIYVEGRVLLTTHNLYFHQTLEEISVMTKEAVETVDGIGADTRDRRWRLSRLTEVHGRRWMLRPQALELFFSDSHELFLNFPAGSKERDRFYAKLRNSCKLPMLWSAKSLNPKNIFRRSKLTELWKKRKISNFEYIMALNRMAGRSFNDITQYPVFPWILSDYTSESIDLSSPLVYRDLSKPVGALNPDRLAQLLARYKDLALFGFSEAERFLYGTHYSSPAIVLHYLIRQEPFATMAIELQSGRFDCPDRLFIDVAASWNSCLTSTTDVKELIPEFFCLPELFLNTNRFPLGSMQTGRVVDHVGLPPWCGGSAYEFVRIHRLALEAEYVSLNLNHWIDLIFGHKQRGAEAEAAHNLFHHLSYEGSVDVDKIPDEVDRNAAESHIQNFGQTPSQLYSSEPHPRRCSADECWKPLIYNVSIAQKLRCSTPSKQFANKSSEFARGSILNIHALSDTILAVYSDMSVGTYRWFPTMPGNRLRMDRLRPLARRELSTSRDAMKRGSAVPLDHIQASELNVGNWSLAVTLGGIAKEELRRNALVQSGRLMTGGDITLATAEGSALLLSCGYWDDAVKVHGIETMKLLANENGGHRGAIRCLAVAQDGALMVTGGQDATVRVWVVDHPDMAIALSDGYVQTALGASNDGDQLLSCCHVLWGHESPVVCVQLDSDLDIVVSGSQSGLLCIHTVRQGCFVRSFRPPAVSTDGNAGAISTLALGTSGSLIVHTEDLGLHNYSLNGVQICAVNAAERLNDIKICSNDEMLITGGERLVIRTLFNLCVVAVLDLGHHGPIRCISLTPDDLNPLSQYMFVGTDDGMITIVDRDPLVQYNDIEE